MFGLNMVGLQVPLSLVYHFEVNATILLQLADQIVLPLEKGSFASQDDLESM
jgi:hypothetical protein